jgi:capsular polysaccharide biosynthesis protein
VSAVNDMTAGVNGSRSPSLKASFVEPESPEEYSGAMIDLSAMREALSRRRKVWIGLALAGLVLGAAMHLLVPAKYAAVTDLYMAEPAGSNPALAIANDVSLLETRAVASQALSTLHLTVTPGTFLTTYQGTAVSNSIISIKLSAASPATAVSYDNAVASAFLRIRGQELGLQTQLVVNGIQQQINTLNSQMKDLTTAINALSSAAASSQSGNQITTLVNERTDDATQITQLEAQRQQDLVGARSVAAGSQVLDSAVDVHVSQKKVIAMDGLTGLVAGLALGIGIVIVGAIISDRPRRRSEVAAALGVPVELSVGRYQPPVLLRQLRLRRSLKTPGVTLQMIARRLGTHLDAEPSSSMATVAIGPSGPAALGLASLALWLASEGKRVVLVDMADGRPLSSLFRAKGAPGLPQTVVLGGLWLTLIVAAEDPSQMLGEVLEEDDAVLVLASVSPALGADHVANWTSNAIVVVTAGKTTGTAMASTTEVLRHAGVTPRSAIMVGAGQKDESVGLVESDPFPPGRPLDASTGGEEVWSSRNGELRRERQR